MGILYVYIYIYIWGICKGGLGFGVGGVQGLWFKLYRAWGWGMKVSGSACSVSSRCPLLLSFRM